MVTVSSDPSSTLYEPISHSIALTHTAMAAPLEAKAVLAAENPSEVFEKGKLAITSFNVRRRGRNSPPKPLLIVTPTAPGSYPVIFFIHGFCCVKSFYSDLLELIASHGYIIVAPQLYTIPTTSNLREIEYASQVLSWLPSGLQSRLPRRVEADLLKLSLVGHSRGGKTAFALALGYGSPSLKFSALIGIDPVAGTKCRNPKPHILTSVPESFNISTPITVIGTGLGPQKQSLTSCPCAPDGFNHAEFFRESKPTCAHFVAAEYGHMDMLCDNPPGVIGGLTTSMCKRGKGSRDAMRRCCSGLVVASLKAYLDDDKSYLDAIDVDPAIAPVKLDPVEIIYKQSTFQPSIKSV